VVALVGMGAFVAMLLAFVGWYEAESHGSPGRAVVVDIRSGESLAAVGSSLERVRVVGSALALRIWFFFHGAPVVRPGFYELRAGEPFAALAARLRQGPNVAVLDVPPGADLAEIAAAIGRIPGHDGPSFLALATSGAIRAPFEPPGVRTLEGLLAPGRYLVLPGESDRAILARMVGRLAVWEREVDLASSAAALGVSPYQALVIASIVQREGVYPNNLGKVARVVYNRLARGMPLQMDATVLYGEGKDGGQPDLSYPSPYNTYLHRGLPPTPISTFSKAALEAALHPTPGPWLYFVVVAPDGTEAFSATYAGQQANEAREPPGLG
jgi:UPF0755 protein